MQNDLHCSARILSATFSAPTNVIERWVMQSFGAILRRSFALFALGCLAAHAASAETEKDVSGARDYPGIGRFNGSVVIGYEVKDFDATRIQAAPFQNGQPADERRIEGRITRIAYGAGPT